MTTREIILNTVARRSTPRIAVPEISFWPETLKRWEAEGLPPGRDPSDYFGLDRIFFYYPDESPGLEERVVEDNGETFLELDNWGRLRKRWKNRTATPVTLGWGARDAAGAEAYLDLCERRENGPPEKAVRESFRVAAGRGDLTVVAPIEPAWFVLHHLLGFDAGLSALVAEPEAIARIMRRFMTLSLDRVRRLVEDQGLRFDGLWFSSDLCYKNGMLFSPRVYRELILPVHLEYRRFCTEHDMLLMLHCDGDVREFIPLVIEAGFDVVQPLEARAGNDLRLLKPLHGDRITLYGNISADVVARGNRDEISEEVFSKIEPAKRGGGYIYGIDHSVPPTVGLESYAYLVEQVRRAGRHY